MNGSFHLLFVHRFVKELSIRLTLVTKLVVEDHLITDTRKLRALGFILVLSDVCVSKETPGKMNNEVR